MDKSRDASAIRELNGWRFRAVSPNTLPCWGGIRRKSVCLWMNVPHITGFLSKEKWNVDVRWRISRR